MHDPSLNHSRLLLGCFLGTFSPTIGQYAEFLNAVAKTNDRGLYNASMFTDQRIRGIEQTGSDGAWVYTPAGPLGTNPVGAQSAANCGSPRLPDCGAVFHTATAGA